jgi:DNA-binding IclR family transcriptional regulator
MTRGRSAEVPVKAVRTSFRIVEELMELDGAGVSELAAALDLPSSTVYDHLKTLESQQCVVKEGGTYRVSVRYLELGGYARVQKKLYRVAAPEIKKLAESSGEHANLMIEEHGLGVFLCVEKGENALSLDTYAGMRVPLQTTALGKAILAHLSRGRVEEIFDRHGLPAVTPRTKTDPDALFDEFERIRDRGYAFDEEERIDGVQCVAVPVFDAEDAVIGAISVSTPSAKLQSEQFRERLPRQVMSTANVIEVNMNYS